MRLIPSAEDSFRQNSRHAEVFKAKIGVKADGTLTALDVDLVVDTGAYTTGGATAAHNSVISAWGCYRIPHLRIKGQLRLYQQSAGGPHSRHGQDPNDMGNRVHDGQRGAADGPRSL